MTNLRVWAPNASTVDAVVGGERHAMTAEPDTGWWSVDVPADTDTAYGFSLDGGPPRPDPRGVSLPDGVHELTRVYDQDAYPWRDAGWPGRSLPGSVVYELHVGTFIEEGTFAVAAERLDHLVDL